MPSGPSITSRSTLAQKANDLSVAVADRLTGSHAAVVRLGLFDRKIDVRLMVGLIGKDGKAKNPGLLDQPLDPIHFLLLNFRNDDFDLRFAVGANLDLLRTAGVDAARQAARSDPRT